MVMGNQNIAVVICIQGLSTRLQRFLTTGACPSLASILFPSLGAYMTNSLIN